MTDEQFAQLITALHNIDFTLDVIADQLAAHNELLKSMSYEASEDRRILRVETI